MSDIQNVQEDQNKLATRFVSSILGLLILKWVIIIGLNRWGKSLR